MYKRKSVKRAKLTEARVRGFRYEGEGKQRDVRWDTDLPSFGIRIYPSGKKTFVLSYRNKEGKKRLFKIGPHGVLTLDQARKKAIKLIGRILDGYDPQEEKLKKTDTGKTVNELCDAYIERYAKVHKKSWPDDKSRIDRIIIPAWGKLPITQISYSEVEALHNKIGEKHPYLANRVLALISVMWNQAKKWKFIPNSHENPAFGITKKKEKKRDRWIRPKEIPTLFEAIEKESSLFVRSALLLYLLSGLRKKELLTAEWRNVDWERKELKIEDTKPGREHYVPLNRQAQVVLRALPRFENNGYIFPGRKPGQPLVNIDKSWRRVRKNAKLEDVRLHDLRRTVGSWLAVDGSSLLVIGKALNHTESETTQIYARLSEDPVRTALERHGDNLEAVLEEGTIARMLSLPEEK